MNKVLIVDDCEVLLKSLQHGFKKYQAHFQPIYAPTGLEAMQLLDEQPVSLVVTDIQMPMIDGVVLLAFIRERFPDIPCIVMTSYGNDELKELVCKDVIKFIDKPVHVSRLAQTIIEELSREKGPEKRKVPIQDFFNLILTKQKTFVFKLLSDENPPGYFYFYKGELFSAVCGKFKGREAVLQMLAYENAQIVFSKPPEQKGLKSINIDSSQLEQYAKTSRLCVEVKK